MRITAADRYGGMTLGELRGALELADRVALPDTSVVRVTVGWRSQLQAVELRRPEGNHP